VAGQYAACPTSREGAVLGHVASCPPEPPTPPMRYPYPWYPRHPLPPPPPLRPPIPTPTPLRYHTHSPPQHGKEAGEDFGVVWARLRGRLVSGGDEVGA
jgi:hypothetical protein